MTVNLTRIYTRLGDGGETHLGDMSRVPKTHPRIEAYGDIDELNSQIGVALATDGLPERYGEFLRRVQNDLFDAGADLSVPPGGERAGAWEQHQASQKDNQETTGHVRATPSARAFALRDGRR